MIKTTVPMSFSLFLLTLTDIHAITLYISHHYQVLQAWRPTNIYIHITNSNPEVHPLSSNDHTTISFYFLFHFNNTSSFSYITSQRTQTLYVHICMHAYSAQIQPKQPCLIQIYIYIHIYTYMRTYQSP